MKYFVLIALLFLFSQATSAQEWNQWRGPDRNGSVTANGAPRSWPKELKATWKVDVGEGYSSPVVSSSRVFINSRRDPKRSVRGSGCKDGCDEVG